MSRKPEGDRRSRDDPRLCSGSRASSPSSLAELIPKVLTEMGFSATSTGVRLLQVWDEALGEKLAPHCRPEGIRRGVVQARVRDSAWMQRIQMEKPQILSRLEQALGEPAGHDLRLRLGPIDPIETATRSRAAPGRSGSSE